MRLAGDEETFAWDAVEVADDDRTITISGIRWPSHFTAPGTWWRYPRAEFEENGEAVRVLLVMAECAKKDPGALPGDDPFRRVTVELPSPLDGRVLLDGHVQLEHPNRGRVGRLEAQLWDRVQRVDERRLVVYRRGGGLSPLSHVALEWEDDELILTLWVGMLGGKVSGGSTAATIVTLDRDLGEREIVDGAHRYV